MGDFTSKMITDTDGGTRRGCYAIFASRIEKSSTEEYQYSVCRLLYKMFINNATLHHIFNTQPQAQASLLFLDSDSKAKYF